MVWIALKKSFRNFRSYAAVWYGDQVTFTMRVFPHLLKNSVCPVSCVDLETSDIWQGWFRVRVLVERCRPWHAGKCHAASSEFKLFPVDEHPRNVKEVAHKTNKDKRTQEKKNVTEQTDFLFILGVTILWFISQVKSSIKVLMAKKLFSVWRKCPRNMSSNTWEKVLLILKGEAREPVVMRGETVKRKSCSCCCTRSGKTYRKC